MSECPLARRGSGCDKLKNGGLILRGGLRWSVCKGEFVASDLVLGRDVRHGDLHDLLPDGDRGCDSLWIAETAGGSRGDDVFAWVERAEAAAWDGTGAGAEPRVFF